MSLFRPNKQQRGDPEEAAFGEHPTSIAQHPTSKAAGRGPLLTTVRQIGMEAWGQESYSFVDADSSSPH